MTQPMEKIIKITISKGNIEHQISSHIIKDFNDFKKNNEFIYCTMSQSKPNGNSIDTSWSTTIKYKDKLLDIDKVMRDFNLFCEYNKKDYCQITKMTCQEGVFVAEFTIFRTYLLDFKY